MPLFIFSFLLLSTVSLGGTLDNCIISFYQSQDELCRICYSGYYLSTDFKCIKKIDVSEGPERIIFVRSRNENITSEKSINFFDYLADVFYSEHKRTSKLLANPRQILRIKLLKGDHYILKEDINENDLFFFERNPVEISMEPLYCLDAPPELIDSCFETGKSVNVILSIFQ